MNETYLSFARQIAAIAQSGLTYCKDVYDIERYQQLQVIAHEMMATLASLPVSRINDIFKNEIGYATPKVDVRAVIFQDNKILLVHEKADNEWALPGGWADIGLSPAENVTKEVLEEAGLKVKTSRLLGIIDKRLYKHPPSPWYCYKIFIACEIISGSLKSGIETHGAGFFGEDELPKLSLERNTPEQITRLFTQHRNPMLPPFFD